MKKQTLQQEHWKIANLGVYNQQYDYILGKECEIVIESRPSWCDRGNFIAKIFAKGSLAQGIDNQDGWPRYYFDLDRAKLEIEAWLQKRHQWVE